jgi:hypothetical protein
MKVIGKVEKEIIKKTIGMRYDQLLPLTAQEVFHVVAKKHNLLVLLNRETGRYMNVIADEYEREVLEEGFTSKEAAYKSFCADLIDVDYVEANSGKSLLDRGEVLSFFDDENQIREGVVWAGNDNMGLLCIDSDDIEVTLMTEIDGAKTLVKVKAADIALNVASGELKFDSSKAVKQEATSSKPSSGLLFH